MGRLSALCVVTALGCMARVETVAPGQDAGARPQDAGAVGSGDGGAPDAQVPDAGPPNLNLLPPDQRIDWSEAGVMKPDGTLGPPDPSTGTRCASLTPSNTLADINAAIAMCSSNAAVASVNQEVFLAAGTYVLTDRISFSATRNVTLRGAGRGMTILQFTGGWSQGGIHLIGSGGANLIYNPVDQTQVRNWTAGYAPGTTVVTLDSVTGLSSGDVLMLDQLNDDAVPGVDAGTIDISTNYTANGGTETSRSSGTRAQQQYVKIVSVDAASGQVTISPGLYMPNWRAAQQPQAYGWSDWTQMSGVEGLTIVNAGGGQTNVELSNCYDCWIRDVESQNSLNSHVMSWETARIEVRDSFFSGTQNADGDSRGLFMQTSTDDLIINNAFEQVTLPISIWGTQASVIAYNFTTDMTYKPYPQILMPGLTTEAGHSALNLFEGNYSNAISMDNNHGGGSRNVVFRNRLSGWETTKTSWTLPVVLNVMNHDETFIGNVLGKAGFPTNYETSYANNANADTSIYGLGYWIYSWMYPDPRYDARAVTTLFRHGNYDYQGNAIRWDAATSDHTLPPSLYLPAPPSWWGSCPWPPFDPSDPAGSDNYLNLPAGRAWHAQFPGKTPTEVGP